MKTVEWDRVIAATPINREAAVARDGRGQGHDLKIDPNLLRSRNPLPTRPVPKGLSPDFTGETFGKLTVIGVAEKIDGKWQRTRWVVRCVCGAYEVRRHETLCKGSMEACTECAKLEKIRQRKPRKRLSNQSFPDHYTPKPHIYHADEPPPLRAVPENMAEDLTGRRIGRLTIIGLCQDLSSGKPRWAVRCDCGKFEVRKRKILLADRPISGSAHQCGACDHTEFMRQRGAA